MSFETDDALAVLQDAGEELWFGSKHTHAIIDEAGTTATDATGMEVQLLGTTAQIRTGSLSGLAEESVVTRGQSGAAYRVRQILPIGDGTLSALLLARA